MNPSIWAQVATRTTRDPIISKPIIKIASWNKRPSWGLHLPFAPFGGDTDPRTHRMATRNRFSSQPDSSKGSKSESYPAVPVCVKKSDAPTSFLTHSSKQNSIILWLHCMHVSATIGNRLSAISTVPTFPFKMLPQTSTNSTTRTVTACSTKPPARCHALPFMAKSNIQFSYLKSSNNPQQLRVCWDA